MDSTDPRRRGRPGPERRRHRRVLRPWAIILLGLTASASVANPSGAQEPLPSMCGDGIVSEITFDRRKPFGEQATSPDASLGWLFRGLNSIHVLTKPAVLRWELLFEEGDCFNPRLLAESARSLRSVPYINEARITSERLPDGNHRVNVETLDAWALSLALQFTVDQGFSFTGVSVNAKNLFGTGTNIALFRNQFRERRRLGILLRQPNLFGSRIDGTIHGGETRSGRYFTQSFYRPYVGQVGNNAFRQFAHTRDDYFVYSVDPALGFTQAYLRFDAERYEATYQRRFGDEDGARFVAGVGVSREVVRFPFGSEGGKIVTDNDFDNPTPAPPDVLSEFAPQVADHSTNRVAFTIGVQDLEFANLIALDAVRAAQDVLEGVDLTLTVAPGIPTGDDPTEDVFVRAHAALAARKASGYARIDADVQSRNVFSDRAGGPEGWRDILYEVNLNGYWTQNPRQALYGRIQFAGGDRMDRPFQLTLGGRESLRGYNADAYPGGRRILVNVEQRVPMRRVDSSFADLGLAFFVDGGRIWSDGVPFGESTRWKASIGAGIRASIPSGAPNVLRIDLGVPLSGEHNTRGVVFRVYSELFGLLDRRAWPTQMQRSRWYGTNPDLRVRPVNPLAGN